MKILSLIRKKSIGAFIGLGVMILSLVSLIVYLAYAVSLEGLMMPGVVILLLLVIAGEIALFFYDNDYIPIAAAACSMAALGCFAISPPETIGSIVDYFQDIVMFGNPDKFGIIIAVVVLLLLTSITAVVGCFFGRVRACVREKE